MNGYYFKLCNFVSFMIQKEFYLFTMQSSKISEAQELVTKKTEELVKQREQEVAEKEERLRKNCEEMQAKRQELTKTRTEKLEVAQLSRTKEEEELKKKTAEKLEQKLTSADKNRMELAEKAKKAKEESVSDELKGPDVSIVLYFIKLTFFFFSVLCKCFLQFCFIKLNFLILFHVKFFLQFGFSACHFFLNVFKSNGFLNANGM